MILTLTIDCVRGTYLKEQCIRVIEMDEKACLYDLHDAIQDAELQTARVLLKVSARAAGSRENRWQNMANGIGREQR